MKKHKKQSIPILLFTSILLISIPSITLAADCTDQAYGLHTEILKKAFEKVADDRLDKAGRWALLKMYKSGITTKKEWYEGGLGNEMIKNLTTMLKIIEITEALDAGDYAKLQKMTIDAAAAASLTAIGVPYVGAVLFAYEVTKESYKQLEHEDCLLNIDIGYYKFLDDPILTGEKIRDKHGKPIDKIDYYLMSYIHGEGTDPFGNRKEQNRRIFQCFINEELPEEERIQVDYSETNPFARAIQALVVVNNRRRLRTPTNVMLRDFSAKKRIEEERQKMRDFMEHPDYKILRETLPVLSKYPLLSEWICDAFVEMFEQEGKEKQKEPQPHSYFGGRWISPARGIMQITQSGSSIAGSMGGFEDASGHWGKFGRKGGSIEGTVEGSRMTITVLHGDGTFTVADAQLSEDRRRFNGNWEWFKTKAKKQRIGSGVWNGHR